MNATMRKTVLLFLVLGICLLLTLSSCTVMEEINKDNDSEKVEVGAEDSEKVEVGTEVYADMLEEAMDFLVQRGYASYDMADTTYVGYLHSDFFDTWSHCWRMNEGGYDHAETYFCVEDQAPNRIFIAASDGTGNILFWQNGSYISPLYTFLGMWRNEEGDDYIDIKEISPDGTVVYSMCVNGEVTERYSNVVYTGVTCFEELTSPVGVAASRTLQFTPNQIELGLTTMKKTLILRFRGSVRSTDGVAFLDDMDELTVHIPYTGSYPTDDPASSNGYMSDFGRSEISPESTQREISGADKEKAARLINQYANGANKTEGLDYASAYFRHLYGYYHAKSGTTFSVWRVKEEHGLAGYYYVDAENGVIIEENPKNPLMGYVKTVVFLDGKPYGDQRDFLPDQMWTEDGAIRLTWDETGGVWKSGYTFDFEGAFVSRIEQVRLGRMSPSGDDGALGGQCERFYFTAQTGNFSVRGYLCRNDITWGVTLHILESNVIGVEVGAYPLTYEGGLYAPTGTATEPPETDDQETDPYVRIETGTGGSQIVFDESDRVIGYIYVDEHGNKTVRDASEQIIGYYRAQDNVTTDASGKVLYQGDRTVALFFR